MNKRLIIIFSPLITLSIIVFYIEIVFYLNKYLNIFIFTFIGFPSICLFPYHVMFVFKFIGTQYNKTPEKINDLFYSREYIDCEQIGKSTYRIFIYSSNKYITFDMRTWIFKKTHIRDIMLLHHHINYCNRKKLLLEKLLIKNFLKMKTL